MARFGSFILFAIIALSLCSIAFANDEEEEQTVFKPAKKSVVARNLVVTKATASSIIKEHAKYHLKTGVKNFKGTVLGYVTPWCDFFPSYSWSYIFI
jgi:hypothetical protein